MVKSKVEIQPLFDGNDKLFKLYLQDCKLYFEYGVGLSTSWVFENSNAKIIAVDTDKEWISHVDDRVKNLRVKLVWVNLGDLTKWGRPNSYKYRNNFIDYVSGVWNFKSQADVILIDGRFRVACFLYSLIHSKKGSIIIFSTTSSIIPEISATLSGCALYITEYPALDNKSIREYSNVNL